MTKDPSKEKLKQTFHSFEMVATHLDNKFDKKYDLKCWNYSFPNQLP